MPPFIEPMQPTLWKYPFSNPDWLFEPKWDGYRALCVLKNGAARFLSRRNNDLTKRFPTLQGIATLIEADNAILDGEIVAIDDEGLPCFDQLRVGRTNCEIVYYAFDLLYLNERNMTDQTLSRRKSTMESILPVVATGRLRVSEYIATEGEALFHELDNRKMEGMVAKRIESLYVSGRSRDWLKIKTSAGKEVMQKRSEVWGL